MITTDRYKHFVQCKDASVQKETDEGKCVFKYIIYCMYYILYYMFYTFIDISAKYVISRSHYMFMARLSYLEVNGTVVELQVRRLPSQGLQFETEFQHL